LAFVKEEWEKKKAAEKPAEPKGKFTGIAGSPI
jgi:hypothetical protein